MRLVAKKASQRPDVKVSWIDLGQRIARALAKDDVSDPEMLAQRIFERSMTALMVVE